MIVNMLSHILRWLLKYDGLESVVKVPSKQ